MSRIVSPEIVDSLLETLRSTEATEDEKNRAATTLVDAIAPDILELANRYCELQLAVPGAQLDLTNVRVMYAPDDQSRCVRFMLSENEPTDLCQGWDKVLVVPFSEEPVPNQEEHYTFACPTRRF